MKQTIIYVLLMLSISCDNQIHTQQVDYSNTTEFQQQNNDVLSYKRLRNRDIVQHLYNQAIENDAKLKNLDNRIQQIKTADQNLFDEYKEYEKYNELYYSSAINYANSIKDSSKRRKIISVLNHSAVENKRELTKHEAEIKVNHNLHDELNDQYKLMKIIISENLIKEYQKSNPTLEPILADNKKHQELIVESENYTTPK